MSASDAPRRVYVWQAPVRAAHWFIFLSVAVLSVTGFYIGAPFITVSGEARQHFVTGTVKVVHSYAAIVFTLSVLARLAGMLHGNVFARWDQVSPSTRKRWRGVAR